MSHSIFDIRRRPLLLCLCAFMGFASHLAGGIRSRQAQGPGNQPGHCQGNDGGAKGDGRPANGPRR